ncbi:MAG TPA: hypothetical protein VF057_01305 [Thermoanaerobaculia bacterium]
MPVELFEAFTGLAALLGVGILMALVICVREVENETPRDWTLRPRRRAASQAGK